MGAHESEAMKRARDLVLGPLRLTAYAAAKQAGISQGAISKSKWYRAHIAAKQPKGANGNG